VDVDPRVESVESDVHDPFVILVELDETTVCSFRAHELDDRETSGAASSLRDADH
jgi:hypothetical protein